MAANKNKMKDRFRKRFSSAGFNDDEFNYFVNLYRDRFGKNFHEDLENMNRDEFNDYMTKEILPFTLDKLNVSSKKSPDDAEHLSKLGSGLIKATDPWSRDRFLQTILRQEVEEKGLDGKPVKNKHIGALSDQDIILLRAAGLDDEEIEYYADKFRNEYVDDYAKKVREAFADSAEMQSDVLSNQVPYHMIDEKKYPILSKLNKPIGALASVFGQENVAELRDAVKKGRDPEILKPTLIDAGVGVGSALIPGKIGGKVASYVGARVAPTIAGKLGSLAKSARIVPLATKGATLGADAVAEGLTDAGLELGRQAASDYYDIDFGNAANAGVVSATIPAGVKGSLGLVGQIPGAQKILQPIMRHVKGTDLNLAEVEQASANQMKIDAQETIDALKGVRGNRRYGQKEFVNAEIDKIVDYLNNSPYTTGRGTRFTREDVLKMMKNGKIDKYLTAPTQKQYDKWAKIKATYEGVDSDYASEALERAANQWPQTVKSFNQIKDPSWAYKGGNIVDQGVAALARKETAEARNKGKYKASPELEYIIRNDPNKIRMWEADFKPNDAIERRLYNEWKQKYGH